MRSLQHSRWRVCLHYCCSSAIVVPNNHHKHRPRGRHSVLWIIILLFKTRFIIQSPLDVGAVRVNISRSIHFDTRRDITNVHSKHDIKMTLLKAIRESQNDK